MKDDGCICIPKWIWGPIALAAVLLIVEEIPQSIRYMKIKAM